MKQKTEDSANGCKSQNNRFLHHDKQKFVGSSQDIHRTNTGVSHHQGNEPTMKHQRNVTSNIQSMEILGKLVKQQAAPDVDLYVFGGNPLGYHYFMTLFLDDVEKIDTLKGMQKR